MRIRTGEDLRTLREQAGLSQTEAAKITGTPLRTWQTWEARTASASHRPPGLAFAFLELYLSIKKQNRDKIRIFAMDNSTEGKYYEEKAKKKT